MEEIDPPVPSGEVTPPTTVRSQLPATHAPPYAPPSMYMPSTPVPPVLPSSNEAIRIAVLEGTVNQMTSNIIELMALLSGPNRASSSSIPPPAYGSMVDPSPWVPPTLAPENDVVPIPAPTHFPATVPPLTHAPEVCPSVAPLPVTLSVTFPPPPMTISIIDPAMLALPPMGTLTTGEERCASSRFPENLSRTLSSYFDEEVSDDEVPPMKPKTRIIERITQHLCSRLPRTSSGFKGVHLQKARDVKNNK
ncbi:hypothetical protein CDL15_Pgr005250 [Punica granatum]|uniref:Extensin-like n=1 Tax=Punica granatum TaxID=22663 RepID=A0A218WVN5_PUNGR|nr:hypothetical protein CDL15_Pgr005250 [Punica granatum]